MEQENWTIKTAEAEEPKSSQEQEQAVVEEAIADNDNVTVAEDDGVVRINLDEPINTETDAEPKDQEADLAEEQAEEEVKPESEASEGEQLRQEHSEEQSEEQEEVIELVSQQEEAPVVQDSVQEEPAEVQPETNLPENVDKLVKFMEETGGSLEDFVNLNKDVEALDPVDAIAEYYQQKYPHYNEERVQRRMNKDFMFDENDDPDVIQDKKDAFEDTLYEARQTLKANKDKYYDELKFNRQQGSTPEAQEAVKFYEDHKKNQQESEKLTQAFQQQTSNLFSNDFKGFDFQVGESKYRFKVADAAKVGEYQADLNNFIGEFAGEDGSITDVQGYHKALYAAKNADKIAKHFYEQGRAEALRDSAAKAKNIDMSPKSDHGSTVRTKTGTQYKVVSGNSSNGLKIKMRK